MSEKSNIQGRAYEYACLRVLYDLISEHRKVKVLKSKSLVACESAWNLLSEEEQSIYVISAQAAVRQLFLLEPRIEEPSNDMLELSIQSDENGEVGDVRDVLIVRSSISWEIGLSLKHNHFAVKHSRLAKTLDFAKSWFGIPCSDEYWTNVASVFDRLSALKAQKVKFRDIADKETTIYVPILEAFMNELRKLISLNSDMPGKLVQYLIGKYDFYKVISVDREKYTSIQAVNIHKTLNKAAHDKVSCFEVPVASLPTRLIYLGFVPNSKNTLELYLDGGWQFTFRIHNASSIAEPSLKFDIQIVGMPRAIITFNCRWG